MRRVAAVILLALACPCLAAESPAARLTFIKVFKGRVPEYMRVTLAESGEATYQGGSEMDPGDAETFRVSAGVTARVFALAAQLNYFRGVVLDSRRDVADLGRKTFVWERGGEQAEATYNFTENKAADELQRLCEGLGRGRHWIREIESRLVFDRLGVLGVLRDFERDFNSGTLVDVEQFVPILERVAADRRLMRLAQTRAQHLLDRIRGGGSRFQFEYGDQRSGWYTRVTVEGGTASYEHRPFHQPPQEKPLPFPRSALVRLGELLREARYLSGRVSSGYAESQLNGYRLQYEAGVEHNEVAFAQPPDAVLAEIVSLCRRALRQEDLRVRLLTASEEKSVTLQVVLQELEEAVAANAVIEATEFVPLLDKIAENAECHPVVREQAGRLLVQIRASR
jgi:hypothetical protein